MSLIFCEVIDFKDEVSSFRIAHTNSRLAEFYFISGTSSALVIVIILRPKKSHFPFSKTLTNGHHSGM